MDKRQQRRPFEDKVGPDNWVGLDLIQMPIFSIISQASSEAQLICLHTVGFFSTATPMPVSCLAAHI